MIQKALEAEGFEPKLVVERKGLTLSSEASLSSSYLEGNGKITQFR